jgi:hypothetical protein
MHRHRQASAETSSADDAILAFQSAAEQIHHGHGTMLSEAALNSRQVDGIQRLHPEDFCPSTDAKTAFVSDFLSKNADARGDDELLESMWKGHTFLHKFSRYANPEQRARQAGREAASIRTGFSKKTRRRACGYQKPDGK